MIPVQANGSGGNGIGLLRTISSRVRSLRTPSRRSSITSAPKRVAPTPSPVNPAAYATLPEWAVPKNAEKREQVSMAPPQAWLNFSPSSCGNAVKKCSASLR